MDRDGWAVQMKLLEPQPQPPLTTGMAGTVTEANKNLYRPMDPFQLSARNGATNLLGRLRPEPSINEVKVPEHLVQRYVETYHQPSPTGNGDQPWPTQEQHPDFGRRIPIIVRHTGRRKRRPATASESSRSDVSDIFSRTSPVKEPQEGETKQRPDAEQEHHGEQQPVGPDPTPLSLLALVLGVTLDQLPRQVYLHLHLRMPALYWSRVSRILQGALKSMGEIKGEALIKAQLYEPDRVLMEQGYPPYESSNSPAWVRLRGSWNDFITALIGEWSALNIISALLLTAILTILQIESAMAWPLARFSALLSLVCAFMSLLYGCIYIIRFSTMKRTAKAAEWALESQTQKTAIFWNVYVMLSLPSVWLGWAMIFFIISVMSMVWQTGTTADSVTPELAFQAALGPRTAVSCVLALGLLYLTLAVGTMKRYGDAMDEAWKARVRGWAEELKTMAEDDPSRVPVDSTSESSSPPPGRYRRWRGTNTFSGHSGPMFGIYNPSTYGSSKLYQERYCSTASWPSPSNSMYRLPLPPSDDRVFKKQEYIDSEVLRWLDQIQPNWEIEEQGSRLASLDDRDWDTFEMQRVEKWMSRSERSGEKSEGQNLEPRPHEEGGDDRISELGIPDRKAVTSELGDPVEVGVMESISTRPHRRQDSHRHSPPPPSSLAPKYDRAAQASGQRSKAGASMHVAAQYTPGGDIDSTVATGCTKANTRGDGEGGRLPHHAASTSSLAAVPPLRDNTCTTRVPAVSPALWPTPLNGLQSTANMRLVASRVAPYPVLCTQELSRVGKLVKVLPLQSRGARSQETSAQVPMPDSVSPQVWQTFTLDVLSAWSNLFGEDKTAVKFGSDCPTWTMQEQHALLNFVALVEMWNSSMFRASRNRLIVLGIDRASGGRDQARNWGGVDFGVYMAPLDVDPLVLNLEGESETATFIRFNCAWVGGVRTGAEPDVYVQGAQESIVAASKPLESV